MKKLSMFGLAALAGVLLAGSAFGADEKAAPKERTLTGVAQCAKCALHESDKCQSVVVTENKAGKKTTYILADSDATKDFHKSICKETKKVSITGHSMKNADGKMEFVASKIEDVK